MTNIDNKDLNNKDLDELLKLRKKQLRIDITILVLIVLIIVLLLFILFRGINCKCEDCVISEDYSVEIVPDNIIRLVGTNESQEGQTDGNPISMTDSGLGETGGSGTHVDPYTPVVDIEGISLSDRDSTHTENQPFNYIDVVPGDSYTKVYAVELDHEIPARIHFKLENVKVISEKYGELNLGSEMANPNSILKKLNLKVVVDGNEEYNGSFDYLINNEINKVLSNSNSVDTVEYDVTVSVPTDLQDNYSVDSDGNYQAMAVNFDFKWWATN